MIDSAGQGRGPRGGACTLGGRNLTAQQIAESLEVGDHRHLQRAFVRGVVGIWMLVIASLWGTLRPRELGCPDRDLFVVANPVAHGARLTAIVQQLAPSGTVLVADRRLMDRSLEATSFPSVAVRSMPAIATLRRLMSAVRLRLRSGQIHIGQSFWYSNYLFLAQAMRFNAARDSLRRITPGRLFLTDFDRAAYVAPLLAAAADRQMVTATLVHGSPMASTYLPVLADHVLAWGRAQSNWFVEHGSSADVHIVGRPDIDEDGILPAHEARAIIAHSRETLRPFERDELIRLLASAKAHRIRTVLRLHPSSTLSDAHRDGWAPVSDSVDEIAEGGSRLALGASDMVIVVSSTTAIDALARGVRVHIAADDTRVLPADLEALRHAQGTVFPPRPADPATTEHIIEVRGATSRTRIREVLAELASRGRSRTE